MAKSSKKEQLTQADLEKMTDLGHNRAAEGELTGHAHRFSTIPSVKQGPDGARYFKADAPAPVEHEQHKTITVPPMPQGIGTVGNTQEYDHVKELLAPTQD